MPTKKKIQIEVVGNSQEKESLTKPKKTKPVLKQPPPPPEPIQETVQPEVPASQNPQKKSLSN